MIENVLFGVEVKTGNVVNNITTENVFGKSL